MSQRSNFGWVVLTASGMYLTHKVSSLAALMEWTRLMDGRHDLTPDTSRAKSVLSALGFAEPRQSSKATQTHAKTSAKNNVQIVDKGNEFPHYTEDTMARQ